MSERIALVKDSYGWADAPEYRAVVETFGEVLAETEWGSYQGDSLYLVKDGDRFGVLTFGWGSCSGCDALRAVEDQADLDKVQDDLENGIRWFDDIPAALASVAAIGSESFLDTEMVTAFVAAIDTYQKGLGA